MSEPLKRIYFCPKRLSFILNQLHQKNPIHVWGLGSFGGNIALIKWLAKQNTKIVLWEQKKQKDLSASWQQLKKYHHLIDAYWQINTPSLPSDHLFFINPAIAPSHPTLKGVDRYLISSEIELSILLLAQQKSLVHVIFGSVAKSTCATLLSIGLDCKVYGNIGHSILNEQDTPAECVLELSSFQLHYLQHSRFIPTTYLFTPLGAQHADWHGSLENYHQSKLQYLHAWRESIPGFDMNQNDLTYPELSITPKLLGSHNYDNIKSVLQHMSSFRDDHIKSQKKLCKFKGLKHRLEIIYESNSQRFINDSKATTIEAVQKALTIIRPDSILILQGSPKSLEHFKLLIPYIKHCRCICLISGMKILTSLRWPTEIELKSYITLKECIGQLKKDQIIFKDLLFSPGAPSYDQYLNYEQRGNDYRELVLQYFSNEL